MIIKFFCKICVVGNIFACSKCAEHWLLLPGPSYRRAQRSARDVAAPQLAPAPRQTDLPGTTRRDTAAGSATHSGAVKRPGFTTVARGCLAFPAHLAGSYRPTERARRCRWPAAEPTGTRRRHRHHHRRHHHRRLRAPQLEPFGAHFLGGSCLSSLVAVADS